LRDRPTAGVCSGRVEGLAAKGPLLELLILLEAFHGRGPCVW